MSWGGEGLPWLQLLNGHELGKRWKPWLMPEGEQLGHPCGDGKEEKNPMDAGDTTAGNFPAVLQGHEQKVQRGPGWSQGPGWGRAVGWGEKLLQALCPLPVSIGGAGLVPGVR